LGDRKIFTMYSRNTHASVPSKIVFQSKIGTELEEKKKANPGSLGKLS